MWGNWDLIEPLCHTAAERYHRHSEKGESKQQLVKAINAIPKEQLSCTFQHIKVFYGISV